MLAASCDGDPAWAERFPCHSGIKLGGYPLLIQSIEAFLASRDPDFQMQIDGSDCYMYGDTGIGYIPSKLSAIVWETM
jgi:hypothetical protein